MPKSASKSHKRRRAHYVISTHWDREWHQTFQDFRYRLVGLLDKILARIESGDLKGPFTCDGQAIILEDYLEIRPEKEQQVRDYLKSGKLVAGPWYVLPDEFLVSGESLIRNIRHGRDVVRRMGATPSNAGFVCDLFGHASQLPQIFLGFGLTGALVWRGIEPQEDARFRWAGADGRTIPTLRFGKSGYCDYNFKVRLSMQYGAEFEVERAREDLHKFLEEEAGRTKGQGPFILFDGGDHLSQDIAHYNVLVEEIARKNSRFEVVHSDLDTFLEEMVADFGDVTKTIKGELREPGVIPFGEDQQWLIPGVGSSRVWIKQQNARCQSMLCQWAEPFSVLATALTGREYPASYLERSWVWLLTNHPHDSICGCSLDQVHEDMKYRFSQSLQISDRATEEALSAIASNIKGELGERELRVTVFNPVPRDRDEIIELTLQIPAEWPCFTEFFGYENKPAFRIYGTDGKEIDYQRIAQKVNAVRKRLRDIKFPEVNMLTEVTVALKLKLPALGYTTLTVKGDKRTDDDSKIPVFVQAVRHPSNKGLAISDHELENEFLRVSVESNGSLSILDKRNGEIYSRLLTFENGADIGDGWYHAPAVNDQHYTSQACSATVALVANGPIHAALRVSVLMKLPSHFDFARTVRSEQLTDLVLENTITLRAGQDFVEVETKTVNTVKDHRLRVLFPSGAKTAKTFLADSAFDVVERPIALREGIHVNRELEVESKPQQSFTAVHTAKRGLAIVCYGGLLESGVRDVAERPIILTLYRSTFRTVMTAGEPEGELLGHAMSFRYRIVPLGGKPDRSALFDRAQELSGGIRTIQLEPRDIKVRQTNPDLAPSGSLVSINGPAVLTSLRQSSGTVELRTFNPNENAVSAKVILALPVRSTIPVNFDSKPCGKKQEIKKNQLPLTLKAKEIQTLSLH